MHSDNGAVALSAEHDVNLLAGKETHSFVQDSTSKKKGTFSSTKTTTHDEVTDTYAIGTTVSGEKVSIKAGSVATIKGSDVVSSYGTTISGANGVEIVNDYDTSTASHSSSKKTSGAFGNGGASFTIGSKKNETASESSSSTVRGSTVGSLHGDTTIMSNDGTVHVQGSTVASPEGNVTLLGSAVNIEEAYNTSTHHEVTKTKQSGITVAASAPVVDAALAARDSARSMGDSKDSRVNAMAAANTAYDTYQVAGAAAAGMGDQSASVSITYGEQKTRNEVTANGREVVGSSVNAGGRTTIVATGDGEDSDIRVSGSNVYGGTGTTLYADDAIDIVAAQSTSQQSTNNSSSGWNVGVAASYGSGGGAAGITAGGNVGKGNSDGTTVTNVNSHVGSGGTTSLISGGTTTIRGGQVSGERVEVDAANLLIESLQDTQTYKSDQVNASAQVTAGYGVSVSGSYNQSKVDSDYASVNEQSGILAGDGGYAINVKGKTELKGGIITSTDAAEAAGKNSFSTGTLQISDIENHADYEGSSFGISGRAGVNGQGEQGQHQMAQGSSDGKAGGTAVNKSVGFGQDDDHQSSTTHSGINTKNITITDAAGQAATGKSIDQVKSEVATTTSTDTVAENGGALVNKFDAAKVQKELDLQVQVTQTFDHTQQSVRSEINASIDEARQRKEDSASALKNDPNLTPEQKTVLVATTIDAQKDIERLQKVGVLVNVIASGLASPADSAGGIATATLAPGASYLIGQHFKENAAKNVVDNGNRPEEGSATHLLTHALLGAAIGASDGGDGALLAALAAGGAEAAAPALAKYMYGKDAADLTADEKGTIAAIVGAGGAMLGGLGNDVTSLINSSNAAQNAANNNWGEVGHYSTMATVLYLTGFSERDAKAIALAGWSLDTDDRNALTRENILDGGDPDGWQQKGHLLNGVSDPAKVVTSQEELTRQFSKILRQMKENEGSPETKAAILTDPNNQLIIHNFGDSFAHVTADGKRFYPGVGHGVQSVLGPDPDNPNTNSNNYSKYLSAIYDSGVAANGGAPRATGSSMSALAGNVSTHHDEASQKAVLARAAGTGGLIDSPVSDLACPSPGNCAQLPIGSAANQVIREIYNVSPPVSKEPPVINWSTQSPGIWGGR